MANDGECLWHDTDAAVWKNTPSAVWASPHAFFVSLTDGVMYGDGRDCLSDQINNGGFDTDTFWSMNAGITISDGLCHFNPSSGWVYQNCGIQPNTTYMVSFTLLNYVQGTCKPRLGWTSPGIDGTPVSGNGRHTEIITTPSSLTNNYIYLGGSGAAPQAIYDLDNVVITECIRDPIALGLSVLDGAKFGELPNVHRDVTLTDGMILGENTISPLLADLLVNGDFADWSADNPVGWLTQEDDSPVSKVTEHANGCQIIRGTGAVLAPYIRQEVLTIGEWYEVSITIDEWIDTGGTNRFVTGNWLYPIQDNLNRVFSDADGTGTFTFLQRAASPWFWIYGYNPCNVVISSVIVRPTVPSYPQLTGRPIVTDGITFGENLNAAYGLSLTDGLKLGETAGPLNMSLSLVEGVDFGDHAGPVAMSFRLEDGLVFGEIVPVKLGLSLSEQVIFGGWITYYNRETTEHSIFQKAFMQQWNFKALKSWIEPNSETASLPLIFNNPTIPIITNSPAKPLEFDFNALEISLNAKAGRIEFNYRAKKNLYTGD
jgi:hypothetical protein